MIYDLRNAINRLPDQKEFNKVKDVANKAVRVHEEDRQFVQKAKRYFEDMKKGVESSGASYE
jgi:hypothetical protein